MRSGLIILLYILSVVHLACDRPFREVEPPSVTVVHPDPARILLAEWTEVRVRATSFREMSRLTIEGRETTFDSFTGQWIDTLDLDLGLNSFVLRAYDALGAVRVDTLRLVRAQVVEAGVDYELPFALGGHTATLLDDGRILVAGGSSRAGGPARHDTYVLLPDGSVQRIVQGLGFARAGHTATRMPDGRVLIAGGSRVGQVSQLADLVQPVEIFDPATGEFRVVPISGTSISRAFHTAAVYRDGDDVLVDFFGGYGDVSFGGGGRLGTRRDIATYRLRRDTLVAVGSPLSGILLEPMAGHTQTSLTEADVRRDEISYIFGSRFSTDQHATLSLVLDYQSHPGAIESYDVLGYTEPRTRHAAVIPRAGAVIHFGGLREDPRTIVRSAESYIHEARRIFRFPPGVMDVQTFGHSATKLQDGRILVIGGFGADLTARPRGRFFRVLI